MSVDDGHTSGSDGFRVTVGNVAPSVQAGPDATIAAGATLARPGSFSDPGSLDSWTATVDYGDGSDRPAAAATASTTASNSSTPTPVAGQIHAHRHRHRRRRRTQAQTPPPSPSRRLRPSHSWSRRAGSGSGQVTGPGIACPGDCTQSYTVDTEVVLQAAADTGSVFTGWGGDCSRRGDCTVTMSSDRSVTATFALPQTHGTTVEAGGGRIVAEARCSRGRVRLPIRMRIAGLRRSTTATGRVR